jgi:hypothetical protein
MLIQKICSSLSKQSFFYDKTAKKETFGQEEKDSHQTSLLNVMKYKKRGEKNSYCVNITTFIQN